MVSYDFTNKDDFVVMELCFNNGKSLYCNKNLLTTQSEVFRNMLLEGFPDNRIVLFDDYIDIFKIVLSELVDRSDRLYDIGMYTLIDVIKLADKYEFIAILDLCRDVDFSDGLTLDDILHILSNMPQIKYIDWFKKCLCDILYEFITKDTIVIILNTLLDHDEKIMDVMPYNYSDLYDAPNLSSLRYEYFKIIMPSRTPVVTIFHKWFQKNMGRADKIADIFINIDFNRFTLTELGQLHDLCEHIPNIEDRYKLLNMICDCYGIKLGIQRQKLKIIEYEDDIDDLGKALNDVYLDQDDVEDAYLGMADFDDD